MLVVAAVGDRQDDARVRRTRPGRP